MSGMLENIKRVQQGETIPPAFKADAFHCVLCVVYAQQGWRNLDETGSTAKSRVWVAGCGNCGFQLYWLVDSGDRETGVVIYPSNAGGAPAPHIDMPADVHEDYIEASNILAGSPRGAGALLRLALQSSCRIWASPAKT